MSKLTADTKGIVLACASCAKLARIRYSRLADSGKCPHCGEQIGTPAGAANVITEAAFENLIAETKLPVIIDFWAPWCQPCLQVAPEIEKLAQQKSGDWLIVKVNTQDQPSLAEKMKIKGIPTMAVYVDGKEISRTSGARPASAIEAFVNEALAG